MTIVSQKSSLFLFGCRDAMRLTKYPKNTGEGYVERRTIRGGMITMRKNSVCSATLPFYFYITAYKSDNLPVFSRVIPHHDSST